MTHQNAWTGLIMQVSQDIHISFIIVFHQSCQFRMNLTLNNKLREFCMRLRKLVDEGKSDDEIYAEKNAMIEQIYRIVSICLGTPPEVRERLPPSFCSSILILSRELATQ